MSLIARKKKAPAVRKSLILHIGSDRVTGTLAVFSSYERPHIVAISEKEVHLSGLEDEQTFMSLFRKAAVVITEKLSQSGHFVPEHVYVSLESPWFTGQTRTVYYSKKEQFVFSQNFAHDLIDRDFNDYKEQAEQAFGEPLQTLDKSVIITKLNGYAIGEPYGKRVREVAISYYASLMPKFFVDSLCSDLERIIRGKIRFFSTPAALSGAIYMTLEHYKKLLVVSIGGEVTELLYLENGILVNTGSFPSGRNFLVRTLGNELKQNPLEIFSLLNMCSAGHAHENVIKKVDQIVEIVEKSWRKALRKGIHDSIGLVSESMPVMTIGSPDTLSWFKKMVENEHFISTRDEATLSAKEWSGIIASDFFMKETASSTIPPLVLADCLYIYGIDV